MITRSMTKKQEEDREVYGLDTYQLHPQFNIPICSNIFINCSHPLLKTRDERDHKCVRWLDERTGSDCLYDAKIGWHRNRKGPGYMILNPNFLLSEREKQDVEFLCRERLNQVYEKMNTTIDEVYGYIQQADLNEPSECLSDYYRALAFSRKTLGDLENISVPRL